MSFIIYGYDDVAELTKILNIEPTRATDKGGPSVVTGGPLPRSIWSIDSQLDQDVELEQHIGSLVDIMLPSKEILTQISKNFHTVISVGAYYYETNPQIELESKLLKQLGDMGIVLWLDMYYEA